MTKLWIGVLTAGLCSNAWAVIDGEPVDWPENDNAVVVGHCTGTRISGQFVLTAAHCDEAGIHWIQDAHHEGLQDIIESVTLHPNYQPHYVSEDFALVKLTEATDYARIQFFADLNAPTYVQDAPITIDGFGGLNNQPPARAHFQLDYQVQNYPFRIEAVQDSAGSLIGGDSGSAWVDEDDQIIAISSGITSEGTINDQTISGRDLHYAADFILDTVNGWHYPTIATAKGRTTIEVQSLHRGGAVDTAYTSGDATIVAEESSCLTGTIAPFERCTYVIDSGGGKGTLHLSDTESVRLNSASSGGSSGGDSGGSAGWATLLALLGCWHSRRKHKKLVYTQSV